MDYDALPAITDESPAADDDNEWEELGTFSVDSGTAGLFSQSALDSLTSDGDRQARIEVLIDARLDDLGEFVPGGVVGEFCVVVSLCISGRGSS